MIIHTCDIDVGFIIQIHDIQTDGNPLITTKDQISAQYNIWQHNMASPTRIYQSISKLLSGSRQNNHWWAMNNISLEIQSHKHVAGKLLYCEWKLQNIPYKMHASAVLCFVVTELILGLHQTNGRRCYFITTSLIGLPQALNQTWVIYSLLWFMWYIFSLILQACVASRGHSVAQDIGYRWSIYSHIFPWLCVWGGFTIIFCHLLHIYISREHWDFFPLLMCSLWYVQMMGNIMACGS